MRRPVIGVTEKNQGEYWQFVNAGWRQAADALGLELRFDAPPSEDVEAQRALMRAQLADGVDALAFVATRPDGFDDIVGEATAAGVPVIAFDLDAPTSGRSYFVGMNTPIEVGRALGRRMVTDGITSGVVYLANGSDAAPGARGKRDGLVEVLSRAGVRVVESVGDHEDEELSLRLAQEAVAQVSNLTAVVGVYGYHPAVLAAVVDGAVPVYGYDLLPKTLDLLETGRVRGVVWIREMDFGIHAAAAVSDILRLGVTTALEIRGMDPDRWADNRHIPASAYITAAEVPQMRQRYSAVRTVP